MDHSSKQVWGVPFTAVGLGLSAFTSGTLASLTLVSVPSMLVNTTHAAVLATWRCTLDTGVRVCPPFAVAASIVHLVNAYMFYDPKSDRSKYLGAAAVSTMALVPFTFMFLVPTNQELFRRETAARGSTAGVERGTVELIQRWGRLNMVRALFPAVGALVACLAL